MFRIFGEGLLAGIILGLLGIFALVFNGEAVTATQGKARAIDGDSLELNGREIRLWGIDAPELNQTCKLQNEVAPCGRNARKRLAELLKVAKVECRGFGEDQYGRLLAVCRTGKIDINQRLVVEGYAFDYGGYADEEAAAKRGELGVWAGDAERPKQFRDRTKAGLDSQAGILDWLFQKLQAFAH
jgi:endonuclease YncB( thermonuclease family)